ncbi:type I polyketide synthase [Pseudomonas sp. RL_15y_Pfl2_60]|uniref:type I polyketide synthase n=1 Tax=Pseudomonas sp. RL_15y_Pfl2_60 TaxID=3088709 RepID=UPI0030D8A307
MSTKTGSTQVALIGSACRFPGGSNTPEVFFNNLLTGQNYVSLIPEDRWSIDKFLNEKDAAGKAYVCSGHFLRDYDFRAFDADFFNFSPREVEALDPQQRLLLELSWEAMENAGLDIENMVGSQTGVFVGGFTVDHLLNQFSPSSRQTIGANSAAGATLTMLSNRISYAFDFRGPSLSVDTACSSSMVALAQAVNAIQSSQCDTALVGGANFILRPEYSIAMSKGRFLAKDGRSKSFDSRADGYGRGEGGGVVVLKNYADALRDGDNILALVEGAGVNQDGRTSGITVPNPAAQQALMQRVLSASGLEASDIDYIEAHGTGTPVGDPLETRAIAQVYGRDGGCVVGSVKANIGHLEAAAGVASIIKAVEMLRNNVVPPIAGLETVNPQIPKEVLLPRKSTALSLRSQPRRIAINSFGYGGTNAHVILSDHPTPAQDNSATPPLTSFKLLPLSARDPAALRERAGQLAKVMAQSNSPALDDLLYTASLRRSHMSNRVAVWGETHAQIAEALHAFSVDDISQAVEGVRPFNASPRLAFVYTGMGPQWWGMGRELLESSAVFRAALEEADAIFIKISGFSILQEMLCDEADSQIKRTELAQPANLMIQIGLTALLNAEGINADAVVGHSVGEVASGWASGALSLEQALLVSYQRSRIQAQTANTGAMLAIGMSVDDASELLEPYGDLVSFAAINSPKSLTVAGDRTALEQIRTQCESSSIFARMLDVEVPYHSPLMEPLKPELRSTLASLDPKPSKIPLYSTVTANLINQDPNHHLGFDAEYWCDNVRNPVYFADTINTMIDDGFTLFIEVGPHPVLRRSLEEICDARNIAPRIASTLWMNKPEKQAVQRAVAEVFAHGGNVDWSARCPQGSLVEMPVYPWQRQVLWNEASHQVNDRLEQQRAPLNALEGGADLNLRRLNYLLDHVVDGSAIMPAAGFLEALCEKARKRWPDSQGLVIRDAHIHQALLIDQSRAVHLHVQMDPTSHRSQLYSKEVGSREVGLLHAEASIYPFTGAPAAPSIKVTEDLQLEHLDAQLLYTRLAAMKLQYGPAFQAIQTLQRNLAAGIAVATLKRPESAGEPASAYVLHPSLLDGCFQMALVLMSSDDGAYLPVSLRSLEVYASLPESIICHAQIVEKNAAQVVCNFELCDTNGRLLARLDGLYCRSLSGGESGDGYPQGDYQRSWVEQADLSAQIDANCTLLIVGSGQDSLTEQLAGLATESAKQVYQCSWQELASFPQLDNVTRAILVSEYSPRTHVGLCADQLCHLLATLQTLAQQRRQLPVRVITRNAHYVLPGDTVQPAQTAIASFLRTARNELNNLDIASIDISPNADLVASVVSEALALQQIDEFALRGNQRFAASLIISGELRTAKIVSTSANSDTGVQLTLKQKRYQANLLPEQPLAEHDYELRVEHFGVQLASSEPVGVVATVTRTSSKTTRFSPGDRVIGLVANQLANVLLVNEQHCVLEKIDALQNISPLLAPVDARAVALLNRIELTPGQTALVIEGVLGDAISQRLAHAGVSVSRVANSFSDWPRPENEQGYDLLAVPLVRWSHEVGFFTLANGGQLIDLGNDPSPLALPAHCNSVLRMANTLCALQANKGYRAALREVIAEAPSDNNKTRLGFSALLQVEDVKDLPNDWLTLDVSTDASVFEAAVSDQPLLQRNGTYLVTGGLGGFGSKVAQWLASNGAGHIVLVGRRGGDTPGAKELLQSLQEYGAQTSIHALDIADLSKVEALIRTIHTLQQPLLGIYHAAGVLADQALEQMEQKVIHSVMLPKVAGAWALHKATTEMDINLQQFVMFSSIATLLGNSRQANYCAANGFLDGLANLRQSTGQHALSIHLGGVIGTGMLDDDERTGQHLQRIGISLIEPKLALQGIGRALAKGLSQVAISELLHLDKWAAYESMANVSPAYLELIAASGAASSADSSLVDQLHQALREMEEGEAQLILQQLIAEVVAATIKTNPERLKPDLTFDFFGVDSLSSTDIKLQLEQKLGVSYSVIELLGAATIAALAERALIQIIAT